MTHMNSSDSKKITIWEFVLDGFLKGLRSGVDISPPIARELNSKEVTDLLRARLSYDDDFEPLSRIAKGNNVEAHKLAVSLMKRWRNKPKVHDLILELWQEKTDISCRLNILWRILDYDDITNDFHKDLYEFVCLNWDTFLQTQLHFLGAGHPSEVLENVKVRLQSQDEKRSKDWAYLCAAFASNDGFGVIELLDRYNSAQQLADDFVRGVAKDLRKKFSTVPSGYTAFDRQLWLKMLTREKGLHRCSFADWRQIPVNRPAATRSAVDSLYGVALATMIDQKSAAQDCLKHVRFCYDRVDEHLSRIANFSNSDSFHDHSFHLRQATAAYEWAIRLSAMHLKKTGTLSKDSKVSFFDGTRADPKMLFLTIPCNMVAAENLSSRLPWQFEGKKPNEDANLTFSRSLCQQLRIVQWEIMPRDLISEVLQRQIAQNPMTTDLKIPSLLGANDMSSLAVAAWRHTALTGQLKLNAAEPIALSADLEERVTDWFDGASDAYQRAFDNLRDSSNYHARGNIYKDFLRWTIQRSAVQQNQSEDGDVQSDLILVHDGEITFYSLLWIVRMMHDNDGNYSHLFCKNPETGKAENFNLHNFTPHNRHKPWCHILNSSSCNADYRDIFPMDLGLFSPVGPPGNRVWYATDRLRSLLSWMLDVSTICMEMNWDTEAHTDNLLAEIAFRLHCKPPPPYSNANTQAWKDYKQQCGDLLARLFCVFASRRMKEGIEKSLQALTSPSCMTTVISTLKSLLCSDPKEIIEKFEESHLTLYVGLKDHLRLPEINTSVLDWLLTANAVCSDEQNSCGNSSPCNRDTAIIRLSRTCYLPVEFLLRRYQPYEMHLIQVPYDYQPQNKLNNAFWVDSGLNDEYLFLQPTTIAFATIIGNVPRSIEQMEQCKRKIKKSLQNDGDDNDWCAAQEWMATYWAVLQGLSSGIVGKTYRDSAELLGRTLMQNAQTHEMKKIIEGIRPNLPPFLYDVIRLYFFSVILDDKTAERIVTGTYVEDVPPEYIGLENVSSLYELLQRAYKLAAKIEYIARKARRYELENITTKEEIDQRQGLPTPSFEDEIKTITLPVLNPEASLKACCDRIFFFAACVAAFRNAIQKQEKMVASDYYIKTHVDRERDHQVIFLVIANPFPGLDGNSGSVSVGTKTAIIGYVRWYAPNLMHSVYLDPSPNKKNEYIAMIPIPFNNGTD